MAYRRDVVMSFFPPFRGMVRALVIVTSAVFLLTYLPAQFLGIIAPYRWFSLQPELVVHNFYVWQVFTYLFMHGGWFHIIFNMFALWMFGCDLEGLWGGRKFLFYYFLTGVGAGILDVALTTLFPPSRPVVTIGASGAIYGVLLAFGLLFPNRPIFLWFIIPVKAKWFVLAMGLIEFFSEVSGTSPGVSHLAHLGGMLFGYLYLRGGDFPYRWRLRYHEWRRARLRRQFEVYMRKQERKDDRDRWVN